MKCNKCGAEVPADSGFCPKCGQPLSENALTNQPAPGAPTPPQGAPLYTAQPVYIQQPVYVQAPQPAPASPAEKDALLSTAGGFWMLIASIVFTLNLFAVLIDGIFTLSIRGIVSVILFIIMDVGFWLLFANGRRKKLGGKSISLIRIPYVIDFVFTVLSFIGNLLIWFFTLNVISLVMGILTFIFQCICFSSVNKTLLMAGRINDNLSVAGERAGKFAAVIMIITASLTLASDIVSYIVIATLLEALKETPLSFLAVLMGGGNVITIVAAVVSFLASISVAVVLIQFADRIKRANG